VNSVARSFAHPPGYESQKSRWPESTKRLPGPCNEMNRIRGDHLSTSTENGLSPKISKKRRRAASRLDALT
jgi:hypothetical protein